MPEGPECKIIARQLNEYCANKTIATLEFIPGSRIWKDVNNSLEPQIDLTNKIIEKINCKGKFIYWTFQNTEINIWNTLGMTGNWSVIPDKKHCAIVIEFTDKSKLYFYDTRHFGTFKTVKTKDELQKKLNSLGFDVLKQTPPQIEDFQDLESLIHMLQQENLKINLVEFLMLQRHICGVGNYLKSEILYASKLSPHRLFSSLNDDEISNLSSNILKLVFASYNLGGASVEDYFDLNDKKGLFHLNFKVYGKEKDPLENQIIKEKTKDKRTTWWVPEIQK